MNPIDTLVEVHEVYSNASAEHRFAMVASGLLVTFIGAILVGTAIQTIKKGMKK